MANIMVAMTLLLIIGLAISRVIVERRRGSKCSGCHLSSGCSSNNNPRNKVPAQRIEIKEVI